MRIFHDLNENQKREILGDDSNAHRHFVVGQCQIEVIFVFHVNQQWLVDDSRRFIIGGDQDTDIERGR